MYTQIKVTEKEIMDGQPEQPDSCPIALACKKQGIPVKGVYMGGKTGYGYYIELTNKKIVTLPSDACNFVEKFDELIEVKPFSFGISIPD